MGVLPGVGDLCGLSVVPGEAGDGNENKLPEGCRQVALATHAEHLPPTIPASSEVDQKLPTSCPRDVEELPRS